MVTKDFRMTNEETLLEMLKRFSYKEGEFTLASGKKSDFFIDCKKTTLSALGHQLCGEVLYQRIQSLTLSNPINGVAAVPLGGCPLASSVAVITTQRQYGLDVVFVRSKQKDHGTMQTVEKPAGFPEKGGRVVLLEDVVTTGGSSIKIARTLRDAGIEVEYIIALVDRLEGARAAIHAQGMKLRSVFNRTHFVKPPLEIA